MENLITVLKISTIEMFYLVGLIILTGFILGVFERLSNSFMQKSFGRKGILVTAWLGTPVHEVGHAVMCIIFKHEIIDMKLLNTKNESGVLGYVNHRYNPQSIYQRVGNLFIGLGPIYSGITALILSMYLLLPKTFDILKSYLEKGINNKRNANLLSSSFKASGILIKSIFGSNNLGSLSFWIFIAAAICISSHIALSKADIKGAQDGLIILFLLVFVLSYVLRFFGIATEAYMAWLIKYNTHLIAFLMVALIFSFLTLIFSLLCYFALGKKRY